FANEFGDTRSLAPNRRRALLDTMKSYIASNLSDPDLDVSRLAAAHYVSPRYVHSVSAEDGLTVASWIRQCRLLQARRYLSDPLLSVLAVATIATRVGFKTPSHFGYVFRTEVGMTPHEWRLTTTGPAPEAPQPDLA